MRSDKNDYPPSGKLGATLIPVLLLTAIFSLNYASRVVLSPLLPAIEIDLKISHALAGSLYLFVSVGFLLGLLGSAFMVARFTHRRTIIFSALAVGGTTLAMTLTHSLWSLRLALLILGLTTGLYLPSGVATITALIKPNYWGRFLGAHEMAPVLACILAPLIVEAFLNWLSWQGVFGVIGCLSIAAGLIFARFGRGGAFVGQTPNLKRMKQITLNPSLWIIIVFLGLAVGSSLGIYNIMPLYLIHEHGMERSSANVMLSLCRVSGLVLVNVAGWASDRLGARRAIGLLTAMGALLTMGLGMAPTSIIVVVVFLQPLSGACLFPAIMKALSELFPSESRNLAVALVVAISVFLGGGVMPAAISWVAEISSFGRGITVFGVVMLAGLLLLPALKAAEATKNGQAD